MFHLYDEYPFNILDIANLLRLTIRRELADSVYVDCPFCQKRKGKLNLNLVKNVWRCNRCGKSGHMFELYAELRGLRVSEAKMELIDLLADGKPPEAVQTSAPSAPVRPQGSRREPVEQSPRAVPEEIDRTMRAMLDMLTLTPAHREHLHSKRGLTDEQIEYLKLRSTPSYKLRHTIPRRLMDRGFTVTGVPGFFVDKYGKWTANFTTWTAGILVPSRSIDGLICGAQIRLDKPIKDDESDPDEEGTKYIWFSPSSKHRGTGSGSPFNLIGDRFARTVYITEGALKAGIAHCLLKRTFLSIQGANNLSGMEGVFQQLHETGTQLIVEALDTDKFSNPDVAKGAQKIYLLAKQCGMQCRSLTWNPNYKGIDDWQIALMRKERQEGKKTNFKEQFLTGHCSLGHAWKYAQVWRENPDQRESLREYLGLDEAEYAAFLAGEEALQKALLPQRRRQQFRIYQLDFSAGQVIPFAFQGIKALHASKYQQPPAKSYRLVCDDELMVPATQEESSTLRQIAARYSDDFPIGYPGRSVAPSDVLELFDEQSRRYFYADRDGMFVPVRFSPALALDGLSICGIGKKGGG